jgi:ribosome-binding protein aMBF1 (putative translation factor)
MDSSKKKALEKGGWNVSDAADFLQMPEEERQLLDARVKLAMAVRQLRIAKNWTQKTLGEKLNTSQPRVAKIERASADVSLDQLVRAFHAVGGMMKLEWKSERTPVVKKSRRKEGSTLVVSISE